MRAHSRFSKESDVKKGWWGRFPHVDKRQTFSPPIPFLMGQSEWRGTGAPGLADEIGSKSVGMRLVG